MKNTLQIWHKVSAIVLALSAMLQFKTNGQVTISPADTNFWQIRAAYRIAYGTLIDTDTGEGGEIAQYKRWENFWMPRLVPTGSFKLAEKAISNYILNFSPPSSPSAKSASPIQANWQSLGRTMLPQAAGNLSSIDFARGVGRIDDIEFDPVAPETIYVCSPLGGVFKSTNGGQLWFNITDNKIPVLSIADIAIDPNNRNVIYVATGNRESIAATMYPTAGIYRSTDGGNTWAMVNNGLFLDFNTGQFMISIGKQVTKILIDQSDLDAGSGLSKTIYLATSIGIYKTTNAHTTCDWTKIYPSGSTEEYFRNVVFKPGTTTTLIASGTDIKTSINSGGTWATVPGTATMFNLLTGTVVRINIAVTPANSSNIYAMIITDQTNSYFFSRYDGTNWSSPTSTGNVPAPKGAGFLAITVSPNDVNEIYLGTTIMYRSLNGGINWNGINGYWGGFVHPDIHDLKFSPDGMRLWVACDGGLFRSTVLPENSTFTTWEGLNTGLGVTTIFRIGGSATNPNLILTGEQDMGSSIYDPAHYGSANPWKIVRNSDGWEQIIDYTNERIMYTTALGLSIQKNTDEWTSLSYSTPSVSQCGTSPNYGPPFIMDPLTPTTFYTEAWGLGKFEISGSTVTNWQCIGSFPYTPPTGCAGGTGRVKQIAVASSNNNYIYAATLSGYDPSDPCNPSALLFKSTDGGGTWTDITPPGIPGCSAFNCLPQILGIAIHPDYPDIIWVCFSGYYQDYKVWMYDVIPGGPPGSMGWLNYGDGLPNMPCNTIVFQNGTGLNNGLYVGTDVGVYYRDASMSQWEPFMDELPNVIVNELEINDCAGKIRAATWGRGLWESDLAAPSTISQPITISTATQWNNLSKAIFGNITLNADLTITNSQVRFAKGGYKITVNSGTTLTVDNSLLESCADMWQGIEVKNGGTVRIINGSRVNDALVAIKPENGSSYEITGSTFNRNETHIKISGRTATTALQTITGNQLLHTQPLKDQSKGISIGSQNFGIYSVFIIDCSAPVSIGSATAAQNNFESGGWGIFISKSHANIYNNSFSNIYQRAIEATGFLSHRVINIIGNTIENTGQDAIRLQKMIDAAIYGNSISNSGQYGLYYFNNPGHYLVVGNPTLAGKNIFTGNSIAAIKTYANSDKDNTKIIICGNEIKDASGEGIQIFEPSLGSDRKYYNLEIKNNTITNLDNDGIKLLNIIGYGSHDFCSFAPTCSTSHAVSEVMYNTISVNASANPIIRGINGVSSPGLRVTHNEIITDDFFNWQNSAIDFSNSPNTVIMRNTLTAGKGVEIRLDMTGSDIFCNIFDGNVVGIQLEWEWLRAANQTHGDGGSRSNTFNNIASWGCEIEVYNSDVQYNQWVFGIGETQNICYSGVTGTIVNSYSINHCPLACVVGPVPMVNYYNTKVNYADPVFNWITAYMYQIKKNQTGQGNSGTASVFQKKLITVENFIAQQKYNSARGLLNTMNPTMPLEQYYKDVYNIHINSRINGIRPLTSSEINTLSAIAEQNPKVAGTAVYSARAILKAEENMDFFDDESGAATITGYAVSNCTSDSLTEIKLALIDTNGIEQNVAYAVTDSTGKFGFNHLPFGLEVLDTTQLYGFKVVSPSGFIIANPQYKTISQWVNSSPLVLSVIDFIPPVAQFTVSTTAITNSSLNFTNSSTGNGLSYSWNFGDGNISTDENPVHTYTEEGQYTSCLIANNDCGSDTFCLPITVSSNFQKTYGGSGNDNGQNIIVTKDGGFAIAGYSESLGGGNTNFLLVKTDAAGVVRWSKSYGGILSEECISVQQTPDLGYILVGRTFSFGAGNADAIGVKTDSMGTIETVRTYGSAGDDYVRSVRITADGGYIFAGVTNSAGAGGNDIMIVKTTAAGAFQWRKVYGGPGNEMAYYLEPASGGYIIVGYREGYLPQKEIFLLKINYSGNVLWMQTYHDGAWNIGQGVDEIKFINLSDRSAIPKTVGYLVTGYTTSYGAGAEDIFAMQTDTLGNIQWVKTYGGNGMEITRSVRQIGGGNYLIGGFTTSFGNGNGDIYMLVIDSTGTLLDSRTYGGAANDMQLSLATDDLLQFTPDRGIVLLSSTNSFGAGGTDMYLIKTKFDDTSECNTVYQPATIIGNASLTAMAVTPTVTTLTLTVTTPVLTETAPTITETLVCPAPAFSAKKGGSGEEDNRDIGSSSTLLTEPNITPETINSKAKAINPEPQTPNVSVFPNPSTGELNIVYSLSGNEKAEFSVYDLIGKKLLKYELPTDKTVYTISDLKLENGVYFYGVSVEREHVVTGRIVLIK